MTYIIAEPCIGVKDTACVDVCPVDCIHPTKNEAEEFEKETSSISILRSASTVGLASRSARSKRSLRRRRLRSGNSLFRSTPTGSKKERLSLPSA